MHEDNCFSINDCKFTMEYFLLPKEPGYKSNNSFEFVYSLVPTDSCISHSSLSSLGAYLIAHSIFCFRVRPHASPSCSTSSKNGDRDVAFPSNFSTERWFCVGIFAIGAIFSSILWAGFLQALSISSAFQVAGPIWKLKEYSVVPNGINASRLTSDSSDDDWLFEGSRYA